MKRSKITVSYLMYQIINAIRSEASRDRDKRKQEFSELLSNLDSNQKRFESQIIQYLSESERKLLESVYNTKLDEKDNTEPSDNSEDTEESVVVEHNTDDIESVQGTKQEVSTQTPLTSVVINNKDGQATYNTDNSVVTIEASTKEAPTEESADNTASTSEAPADNTTSTNESSAENSSEAEDKTTTADNTASTSEVLTTENQVSVNDTSVTEEAKNKTFLTKVSDGFNSIVSSVTSVGKSVKSVYDRVKSSFEKLWDWLPEIFIVVSAIALTIRGLWRKFKTTDTYAKLKTIVETLGGLIDKLSPLIKGLQEASSRIAEYTKSDFERRQQAAQKAQDHTNSLLERVGHMLESILNFPGAPAGFVGKVETPAESEPISIEQPNLIAANTSTLSSTSIQTNNVDQIVNIPEEPNEGGNYTNVSGSSIFSSKDVPEQNGMNVASSTNVVNNYNMYLYTVANDTNISYC